MRDTAKTGYSQEQFIFENKYVTDFLEYQETVIGSKARSFDVENPHVYELLKQFSAEVRRRGYDAYSINSVFERIRWHTDIETTNKTFKLSNNHRAYYARKLMALEREFEGFFDTREDGGRV